MELGQGSLHTLSVTTSFEVGLNEQDRKEHQKKILMNFAADACLHALMKERRERVVMVVDLGVDVVLCTLTLQELNVSGKFVQ